jgi:hypothetical protein
MTTKKKRKFDLEKGLADFRAGLEKLRQTPPPKTATLVGKAELLAAAKAEIAQMYKDGYTLQMIADALSNGDQYGILPSAVKAVLKTPRGSKKAITKQSTSLASESKPKEEAKLSSNNKEQDNSNKKVFSQTAAGTGFPKI